MFKIMLFLKTKKCFFEIIFPSMLLDGFQVLREVIVFTVLTAGIVSMTLLLPRRQIYTKNVHRLTKQRMTSLKWLLFGIKTTGRANYI